MVSAVGAYTLIWHPFRGARTDLVTHEVHYGRLELTIVESGTLESAKNTDIVCRVKAKSQQAQTSTTIKWVIDDGTHVLHDRPRSEALSIISWDPNTASFNEKPGSPDGKVRVMQVQDKETGHTEYADLLVELDESGLQEQLKDQKIILDNAESAWIQAQQTYKIDEEKYTSDKKSAETDLELAKIDLEKYEKGDYPQSLKDVAGRVKIAESDLEQQRDRAAWAQRMLKKGYYTVSQTDSEQSKLQSYELALAKVLEERRVLTDPAYGLKKRTETDYKNKVDVKAGALRQVEKQWVATEVKDRTDRDTKKSIYDQGLSKYTEIKGEIKKCRLYAPEDGLVVYYVSEQTRWGVGRQAVVAQSENVSENQKLMQIPDLKHMIVNTKVHEALVSRTHTGQPALVRVDALADRRLKAHVESVANTASQQDFFAADVKVYATKIMIDEEVDGLKPGMTAEVMITVADALDHVLTIPVEAIIGSAEMGKTRKCYVLTSHGPEERDIVVGMTNEKEAEIREGLKEGDEVVLNPRALVGDKAKTHQPGETKGGAPAESGDQPATGPKRGKGGPIVGKGDVGASEARPSPGGDQGGVGKGAPGTAEGGGFSPEDRKKREDQTVERFRGAKPGERKQMLEKIPEQWRDNVKQLLKKNSIEVQD